MKVQSGLHLGTAFPFYEHGDDRLCRSKLFSFLTMLLIVSSSRMILKYGVHICIRHLQKYNLEDTET